MSNKMFFSIQGAYNYDSTIFDGLIVPNGVDKDVVIQQITMDASDLELLYPNCDAMKNLITHWSKVELPIWEKYYYAQIAEYEPLYNVDAYESEKEIRNLKGTSKGGSSSNSERGTNVSAYNENSMVARDINTDETSSSSQGESTDTGTIEHIKRRYGNIGVTKSTDLLRDYKDYISETDIYRFISDSFIKRFCLMVY